MGNWIWLIPVAAGILAVNAIAVSIWWYRKCKAHRETIRRQVEELRKLGKLGS